MDEFRKISIQDEFRMDILYCTDPQVLIFTLSISKLSPFGPSLFNCQDVVYYHCIYLYVHAYEKKEFMI